MDSHQSITHQFKSTLQSQGRKILFLLALMAGVLFLAQYATRSNQVKFCGLFDGCELRQSDMHRMEMALGAEGLNDFEFREGKIFVPRNLRSDYLKALEQHDAAPAALKMAQDETPTVNPFMSRSQQKVIAASQKKKQIQQMISQLPFVDQVWLELDAEESSSAFAAARQSALVSVQPAAANALTSDQVETVRRMVDAALAGIERDQIVIADMNVGRAYQAQDVEELGTQRHPLANFNSARTHNLKLQTESRVRQALADYQQLAIQIQVHTETPPPIAVEQVAAIVEVPEEKPAGPFKAQAARLAIAGANGKASIRDAAFGESEIEKTKPPVVARPVVLPPKMVPQQPVDRVLVNIAVPESVLHERVRSKGEMPTALNERQNRLQGEYESLRAELFQKVATCLPEHSFDPQKGLPINVSVLPMEIVPENQPGWQAITTWIMNWRANLKPFILKHWPTMAALLVGVMLLSALRRSNSDPVSPTSSLMPQRDTVQSLPVSESSTSDVQEPEDSEITFRIDSHACHSKLESESQSDDEEDSLTERERDALLIARKQLSEAIDKDPEATAQVIKTWIRDAA